MRTLRVPPALVLGATQPLRRGCLMVAVNDLVVTLHLIDLDRRR